MPARHLRTMAVRSAPRRHQPVRGSRGSRGSRGRKAERQWPEGARGLTGPKAQGRPGRRPAPPRPGPPIAAPSRRPPQRRNNRARRACAESRGARLGVQENFRELGNTGKRLGETRLKVANRPSQHSAPACPACGPPCLVSAASWQSERGRPRGLPPGYRLHHACTNSPWRRSGCRTGQSGCARSPSWRRRSCPSAKAALADAGCARRLGWAWAGLAALRRARTAMRRAAAGLHTSRCAESDCCWPSLSAPRGAAPRAMGPLFGRPAGPSSRQRAASGPAWPAAPATLISIFFLKNHNFS